MKRTALYLALAGLLAGNAALAETTITLDNLTLSGVVELEAAYEKPETGASSGDFVVATTEIAIGAEINSLVSAEIVLLYEEGDTPLEVDVSTLTISPEGSDWYITGGQQYLPFGSYQTNMIADPMTLEMGETRESALVFGTSQGPLSAAVFVFNGDEYEGNNVGINLAYQEETVGFSISYLDNLAESDGITGLVNNKKVAGMTAAGYWQADNISIIAEYIASLERFDSAVLAYKGRDAEPVSWNLELALATEAASYALGYQVSDEAVELGFAKSKVLAAVSVDIAEATSLSFELAEAQDYDLVDGGTTGEKTTSATAMLAVEF